MKPRNYPAKYGRRINKPKVHRDRKKDDKRGYVKHKKKPASNSK